MPRRNATWPSATTCLGDLSQQLGQTTEALDFYQKALAISERLAEADPENAQVQNDLSVSYERLGDVVAAVGPDERGARLLPEGPGDPPALGGGRPQECRGPTQPDASATTNSGRSRCRSGQKTESLDFYQKALPIRERLAEADPKNAQAQRDLGFSLRKTRRCQRSVWASTKESLDFYQKAQAIYERLAAADPKNVNAQRDVAAGYYHLACGFARLSASADKDGQAKAMPASDGLLAAGGRQGVQGSRPPEGGQRPRFSPRARGLQEARCGIGEGEGLKVASASCRPRAGVVGAGAHVVAFLGNLGDAGRELRVLAQDPLEVGLVEHEQIATGLGADNRRPTNNGIPRNPGEMGYGYRPCLSTSIRRLARRLAMLLMAASCRTATTLIDLKG